MDTRCLISVTNLILLRHLESGRDPPFLTGYLIHTQNSGFWGDRGYVIYTKKSRILERGYLIEGGGHYSQLGGTIP